MSDIALATSADVALFDPQRTKRIDAQADAIIARASLGKARRLDEVPHASGVYAFFTGEVCEYVGESRDLYRRLASHERRRELPDSHFGFFVCRNHKAMERWLIVLMNPRRNGKSPGQEAWEKKAAAEWAAIPLEERITNAWRDLFGEEPMSPNWLRLLQK